MNIRLAGSTKNGLAFEQHMPDHDPGGRTMAAVHLRTIVGDDGTLTVRGLPSLAGHRVDVLVRDAPRAESEKDKYPLRGRPLLYEKPFDSVAGTDWEADR